MQFDGISALVVVFMIFAIPISIVTYAFAHARSYRNRHKQLDAGTVIAEYNPPKDLTPAELGYLLDSRINLDEMSATFIELEQAGLVKIAGNGARGLAISPATDITPTHLPADQQYLLSTIGEGFDLNIFYLRYGQHFKSVIRDSLVKKGFIASRNAKVNYYAQRTIFAYLILTITIFILINLPGHHFDLLFFVISFILLFIFGFPFFLGLALLAGFIYTNIAGEHGIWTEKLKSVWPQIEGYEEYIRAVELDNIQFDSSEVKAASKNKVLPYAVALGLNTEWQKRFS